MSAASLLFPRRASAPAVASTHLRPPTESVATRIPVARARPPLLVPLPDRTAATTLRRIPDATPPTGPPMPALAHAGIAPSQASIQMPAPASAAPQPSAVVPGTIWLRPAIRRPPEPATLPASTAGRQVHQVSTALQRENPRFGHPLRQRALYARSTR